MIDVPVTSVATDAARQIPPDASITQAAAILRQPEVEAVIVADESGAVVGIVTESDIVAVVAEGAGDRPVGTIMSEPVVTVEPSIPIGLAADRMRDAGITRLPVVDEDGTYLGLVTPEVLAPYLSRHRLEIEWNAAPLSLEDRDRPDGLVPE